MFGFTSKEGNSSYFAGTGVEVMKTPYKGTNGHIAVSTNYIDRAVSYLEMLGYEFDMSTAKYDAKNNLKAVYLQEKLEICSAFSTEIRNAYSCTTLQRIR